MHGHDIHDYDVVKMIHTDVDIKQFTHWKGA